MSQAELGRSQNNKTLLPGQGVSIGFGLSREEYIILKGECSVTRGKAEGGVTWDSSTSATQGETILFGELEGAIIFNSLGNTPVVYRRLPRNLQAQE